MGGADVFDRMRRWLFEAALPKWAAIGFDPTHGGAIEALDPSGRAPAPEAFMRTRVTARQIYVFSHAAMLGWPHGDALAAQATAFLAQRRSPDGGWPRRLTPAGTPLDPTPDLYDIAFVLFALGWRVRASGDETARRLAAETVGYVTQRMRHPNGRGFLHAVPAAGPRVQNPHMHLLEAALVCFEATGEPIYAELADELTELFETCFYDPATGTLGEHFDEDWRRQPGDLGRQVEPGHMFEWAWILAQRQRLLGGDHTASIRALVAHAEAIGVDRDTGLVFNVVRDDGQPIDRGSRTWPNTERMKGWLALFELTGADPMRAVRQSGTVLFDRYLSAPVIGAWRDRIDADGRLLEGPVPASTFYHVFLAFAEALRLQPALERAGLLREE